MSYFFGSTGANGFAKRATRKHARHRNGSNDGEITSIHGSKHRRKRSSRAKSILKPKSLFRDTSVTFDLNGTPPKDKSKRRLRREIARLTEENDLLKAANFEGCANPISAIKERDELLLNLRKKYLELEQSHREAQTDRDRLSLSLAQRENELRQSNARREEAAQVARSFEQERNKSINVARKLNIDNCQLREDVDLLKNLVYRLNVEIERYQDKLRSSEDDRATSNGLDETEIARESGRVAGSWGKVHLHALAPLLNAYDENINEKDSLVQRYKTELDRFTGRLKGVVAENEDLRAELESFKAQVDKRAEETTTVEKDAALVREHNELLSRQIALQRHKLQEVHAAYERKVESMSRDNDKLHADYIGCKSELSRLRGKYEITSQEYERVKAGVDKTMPVSVHNQAVDECRRLFQELKQQYESERKKLNGRVEYLEEALAEHEKRTTILVAERDQLTRRLTLSEEQSREARHELNDLRKISRSVENSRDVYEEKLTKCHVHCRKLIEERKKLVATKNKLAELVEEKQKESENIQYLGSNIAWRMSSLKSQLKIVQESAIEQLASVEKRLKNQEQGAERSKAEYQRELQRLKQLLLQKDQVIHKLQREKATTQDNLEMMWKTATFSGKK